LATWLLVFVVWVVYDVLYVLWNHFIYDRRPHLCAATGVSISAIGIFGVINVTEDRLLAVPQLCGVLVGSYVGMWLKGRLS
jgi:hypothetical protein